MTLLTLLQLDLSGVPSDINPTEGASSGTSTVTGVATGTVATQGSSAGSGSATGITAFIVETVGTAAGVASVAASGAWVDPTVGTSNGLASVSANVSDAYGEPTIVATTGSAAGVSSASGVTGATASTNGQAAGTSTVSGYGRDASQPEEAPNGGGGKRRAKIRRPAAFIQPQPSAREVAIEAIAERRTRDVHRQAGLVPPSPTLPEPVQRIAREIMRTPLPKLTRETVEQRIPQGKQAWKWREAIERRAARARKPDEGAAAMRELMDNTAALQEQLAVQQRRELDLVFVMAVMATEEA